MELSTIPEPINQSAEDAAPELDATESKTETQNQELKDEEDLSSPEKPELLRMDDSLALQADHSFMDETISEQFERINESTVSKVKRFPQFKNYCITFSIFLILGIIGRFSLSLRLDVYFFYFWREFTVRLKKG